MSDGWGRGDDVSGRRLRMGDRSVAGSSLCRGRGD